MKVIQLDRRHNLYRRGYVWAFKFDNYNDVMWRVERVVKQCEPSREFRNTYWGKVKKDNFGYTVSRPYYVGFRNRATETMVRLMIV